PSNVSQEAPYYYNLSTPTPVTVLVKNQTVLKNLFKIVSSSLTDNFYKSARIEKQLLEEYREGLLIGSACDSGEVFTAMMQKPYDEAKKAAEFYDYLEVFPKALYRRLLDREVKIGRASCREELNTADAAEAGANDKETKDQ